MRDIYVPLHAAEDRYGDITPLNSDDDTDEEDTNATTRSDRAPTGGASRPATAPPTPRQTRMEKLRQLPTKQMRRSTAFYHGTIRTFAAGDNHFPQVNTIDTNGGSVFFSSTPSQAVCHAIQEWVKVLLAIPRKNDKIVGLHGYVTSHNVPSVYVYKSTRPLRMLWIRNKEDYIRFANILLPDHASASRILLPHEHRRYVADPLGTLLDVNVYDAVLCDQMRNRDVWPAELDGVYVEIDQDEVVFCQATLSNAMAFAGRFTWFSTDDWRGFQRDVARNHFSEQVQKILEQTRARMCDFAIDYDRYSARFKERSPIKTTQWDYNDEVPEPPSGGNIVAPREYDSVRELSQFELEVKKKYREMAFPNYRSTVSRLFTRLGSLFA